MNDKIISLQDIEELEEDLASFNSYIVRYYAEFDSAIKKFENTPITQSFYQSGNFGEEQKQYIIKLRNGLQKYIDSISEADGLVERTKNYISTQKDLLMLRTRGYTATDSHRARRGGNNG